MGPALFVVVVGEWVGCFCSSCGRMGPAVFIPPANFVCGGYTDFTLSVRPSVGASVRNILFP